MGGSITGEGGSIAPQNEKTLAALKPALDYYKLTIDFTTLDGCYRRDRQWPTGI